MSNFKQIMPHAEAMGYYDELLQKYKTAATKKAAITRYIKDEQSQVDSMKECLRGKDIGHYHGDLISIGHIDASERIIRSLTKLRNNL